MQETKGILHIVRNFHEMDDSGVYDVTFTLADNRAESHAQERIRRFFGEQQLTEFLKKHLHRPAGEVDRLLQELQRTGHARIAGLELPQQELRKLDLAA